MLDFYGILRVCINKIVRFTRCLFLNIERVKVLSH
jgi:hypothetical protein